MLKFEKKVLDLEVYGEKYLIKFPTIKQQNEYVKKYDEAKHESKNEVLKDYLADLGLPQSVFDELYPEDAMQIVESLMGLKKN